MKKKNIFVGILICLLIISVNTTVKAKKDTDDGSMFLVGKDGYDDKDDSTKDSIYAPSVKTSSGDSLSYSISGERRVGYGKPIYNGTENSAILVSKMDPKIIITNKTNVEKYSTNCMIIGDTLNVNFCIVDSSSNVSPKDIEGGKEANNTKTIELDEEETEYYIMNGTRSFNKSGTWHVRYKVNIRFKKATNSQLDIKIPIAVDNNMKVNVHIVVNKVKHIEELIRDNAYLGKGYIKDTNTEKLKIEGDTISNNKHKFNDSGTPNDRAKLFIESYGITSKTSKFKDENGNELSATPNFVSANQKDKSGKAYSGITKTKVGFNFESTKDQIVYSAGVSRVY